MITIDAEELKSRLTELEGKRLVLHDLEFDLLEINFLSSGLGAFLKINNLKSTSDENGKIWMIEDEVKVAEYFELQEFGLLGVALPRLLDIKEKQILKIV